MAADTKRAPGFGPVRVIVTRPAAQALPLVASLQSQGIDAVALPLIAIAALDDPAPIRRAWHTLEQQALVFFVSANAVQHFFAAAGEGSVWPQGTWAAAPGPGTGDALRAAGVAASQVVAPDADAAQFDSESLWRVLATKDWSGRQVMVVRGQGGRDWLAEHLKAAGAQVSFLEAYARRAPTLDRQAKALLADARDAPERHLWWFSSAEAVRNLQALGWAAPEAAVALATHPRIAEAARRAGFRQVHEAAPGEAGLHALLNRGAGSRSIQSRSRE